MASMHSMLDKKCYTRSGIHTHSYREREKYVVHVAFHANNIFTKATQRYIICTSPVCLYVLERLILISTKKTDLIAALKDGVYVICTATIV
jgi:hypothetical protein